MKYAELDINPALKYELYAREQLEHYKEVESMLTYIGQDKVFVTATQILPADVLLRATRKAIFGLYVEGIK